MSLNILNIGQHVLVDNSIVNCQIHSHPLYANTTLNNFEEMTITIQTLKTYILHQPAMHNIFKLFNNFMTFIPSGSVYEIIVE